MQNLPFGLFIFYLIVLLGISIVTVLVAAGLGLLAPENCYWMSALVFLVALFPYYYTFNLIYKHDA